MVENFIATFDIEINKIWVFNQKHHSILKPLAWCRFAVKFTLLPIITLVFIVLPECEITFELVKCNT